jgi:GT2 family glycosyltransferase
MQVLPIDVSVIIVNYNSTQLLLDCVKSVMQHTQQVRYEIIVVDNASPDNGYVRIKEEIGSNVKLIVSSKNLGFGGANNLAIREAKGKYVFLLNPDTILLNDAISLFFQYAEQHSSTQLGALGAVMMDANRQPTISYDKFLSPRNIFNDALPKRFSKVVEKKFIDTPISVDFIGGADLFVPQKVLNQIGVFDETFFMYCEEADLQQRMANAGLQRIVIPGPQIIHLEGSSYGLKKGRSARRRLESDRSKCLYVKKHYSKLQYYLFRIAFFFVRQPAVFNPHYKLKENLSYLKMLLF